MTVMRWSTNQPNDPSVPVGSRSGIWVQPSVSPNNRSGSGKRWMVDSQALHGEEAAWMARAGRRALARRRAEDTE